MLRIKEQLSVTLSGIDLDKFIADHIAKSCPGFRAESWSIDGPEGYCSSSNSRLNVVTVELKRQPTYIGPNDPDVPSTYR